MWHVQMCRLLSIWIGFGRPQNELGRGGGRNGKLGPKEELMKVVWKKRGRGRCVNLFLHVCSLLLVISLTYEWVWELGQVGGVVVPTKLNDPR